MEKCTTVPVNSKGHFLCGGHNHCFLSTIVQVDTRVFREKFVEIFNSNWRSSIEGFLPLLQCTWHVYLAGYIGNNMRVVCSILRRACAVGRNLDSLLAVAVQQQL